MQTFFLRRRGAFFIVALTLITTSYAFFRAAAESEVLRAPDIQLVEFATGFDQPVDIAHAGDDRLFVVEQKGKIRIMNGDGTILPTPFLDLESIENKVCPLNQGGLLGLAFHPDYTTNGYFFVNYTTPREGTCDINSDINSHISRFQVNSSDSDRNVADPNSELVVLVLEQPLGDNNGGDLAFGPQDGHLYIPTGDGGTEGGGIGDAQNRAQDRNSLFGKILRLDPSLDANVNQANPAYTIPADNPFVNDPNTRDEIWAFGLRNPWRLSFDRQTGDMYVGDVGLGQREEINFQPASSTGGENYGWRCYEGSQAYNTTDCNAPESYVSPITEYNTHQEGLAVTGGYVYRGHRYPAMRGYYLFADFGFGVFWSLIRDQSGAWQKTQLTQQPGNFSSFGEDANGELYVAKHDLGNPTGGVIYHLVDNTPLYHVFLPVLYK